LHSFKERGQGGNGNKSGAYTGKSHRIGCWLKIPWENKEKKNTGHSGNKSQRLGTGIKFNHKSLVHKIDKGI